MVHYPVFIVMAMEQEQGTVDTGNTAWQSNSKKLSISIFLILNNSEE